MRNPFTTDLRPTSDGSDEYVVVDRRRIILGLPDDANVSALLPAPDAVASARLLAPHPGARDRRDRSQ
jgi:hypothetical protein